MNYFDEFMLNLAFILDSFQGKIDHFDGCMLNLAFLLNSVQ